MFFDNKLIFNIIKYNYFKIYKSRPIDTFTFYIYYSTF